MTGRVEAKTVFLFAICSILGTATGCIPRFSRSDLGGINFVFHKPVEYPKQSSLPKCTGNMFIKTPTEEDTELQIDHSFVFDGEPVSVEAQVSNFLYRSAMAQNVECEYEEEHFVSLYRGFVEQGFMHSLYSAVLQPLRNIRKTRNLDDSEYARLIVRFVQSLDYCKQNSFLPKAPVTTTVQGCGDCDEKSILLAGLLAAEQYDVALFTFTQHMAVGIATDDSSFRRSGYHYVESTIISRIGLNDESTKQDYLFDPFKVGYGTKTYTKSEKEIRIDEIYDEAIDLYDDYQDNVELDLSDATLSLKNFEETQDSLKTIFTKLSHDRQLLVLYGVILVYINHTPHSPDKAISWCESMLAWGEKLRAEQ